MRSAGDVILGQYRLERELGEGAFSEVWKAIDLELERPVAIKFLKPSKSEKLVARLLREAKILAQINHPNVVHVHATKQVGEQHLMVLEFVHGDSLRVVLRRDGARGLPLEVTYTLFAQIVEGVAAAHNQQIIHRDLKPENVLVTRDARGRWGAKVLDFGLGRLGEATASSAALSVGTYEYMSPEQSTSATDTLGPTSDVFSLGVMLVEMLTGSMLPDPSTRVSWERLADKHHAEARLAELRASSSNGHSELWAVAARALSRSPSDRFASAEAMLVAVLAAVGPRASAPHPAAVQQPAIGRSIDATAPTEVGQIAAPVDSPLTATAPRAVSAPMASVVEIESMVVGAAKPPAPVPAAPPPQAPPSEPPISPEMQALVGSEFGPYKIKRLLGEGAFGAVFEASKQPLNKRVALKLLHKQWAHDTRVVERFLQEARAASSLRHAHIVDVDDLGARDGIPWIAMEFLEGESLASKLLREGRLSVEQALEFMLPIFSAVAAIHEKGIIHRDLKPENVQLWRGSSGALHPKLLDFGIAKVGDGASSALTGATDIMGTPEYMAPEQWRGSKFVSGACDQWALAVIVYRLVTGVSPFADESPQTIMYRVSMEPPPPFPRDVAADGLEAVLRRALEKEPTKRFSDVSAFAAALLPFADAGARQRWKSEFGRSPSDTDVPTGLRVQPVGDPYLGSIVGSEIVSTPRPSGRPLAVVVAGVVVVAVAIVGGYKAFSASPSPTNSRAATQTPSVAQSLSTAPQPARTPSAEANSADATVATPAVGQALSVDSHAAASGHPSASARPDPGVVTPAMMRLLQRQVAADRSARGGTSAGPRLQQPPPNAIVAPRLQQSPPNAPTVVPSQSTATPRPQPNTPAANGYEHVF